MNKRILIALSSYPGNPDWGRYFPKTMLLEDRQIIFVDPYISPRRDPVTGKHLTNFDFMLDFTYDGRSKMAEGLSLVNPIDVITIDRKDKARQLTPGAESMLISQAFTLESVLPNTTTVVVKPRAGARSMNLFCFNIQVVSITAWATWFATKGLHRPSEVTIQQALMEEFGDKVVYCSGEERYDGEALSVMPTSPFDFIVTKWVDVDREFRVIVSGALEPLSIQERKLTKEPGILFPKNNLIEKNKIKAASDLSLETMQEIMGLVRKDEYRYNAVDVFEDIHGRFGVFEHSPEFGVECIDSEEAVRIHEKFLVSAIKEWESRKDQL
jgi:hypothetical protein